MEAIKADLIRDQEEIQEIQQRLVELQERTRANRAWLKAYGFGEPSKITSAHEPDEKPAVVKSFEIEQTVAAALEIEGVGETAPMREAAAVIAAIERPAPPESLADSPSPLKAEGRKKLYDALISRGARIQS